MTETRQKPSPAKRFGALDRNATFIGVDVRPETKQMAMRRAEKEGRTLASYVRRLIEREVE